MTWTMELHGARPLTINRVADMHRQQWATHTRAVRKRWAIESALVRPPVPFDRVHITVTPLHKDNRSPQDPAACAAEFKAALDGIVDAGIAPGDDGRYVSGVTFLPPDVCGHDGLRITLTETTNTEDK